MSDQSPAPASPPRLIACVILLAISIVGAFAFAKAFETAPAGLSDAALCGDPALQGAAAAEPHASHGKKKSEPVYYAGGIWSPQYGLGATLDAAMLNVSATKPIVCQSAFANGENVVVIDRSPIQLGGGQAATTDSKPTLILSIDYAGGTSSIEYPAASALQKYITAQQPKYVRILIVEPLPGSTPDPDEDWTYLNFNSDENIEFLTPKRKAKPAEVALAVYEEIGGSPSAGADIATLIGQLGSEDKKKAAAARLLFAKQSPYQAIPQLNAWLQAAEAKDREARLYEALMVRRLMGVHADALIAEAAASENTQLRALAARTIGDLAGVTTNPIALLTPLAEDDVMAVRYEALIATRAMPGQRAAGVSELVEPYEMNEAMRAVYRGTMDEMLAYGEPIPADSRANRLRRMAISDLLNENRGALVCTILLERTDLPDNKIDEVLGQLAEANGRGPLVMLLNLLEAMNPRTLAQREVLLKKLVEWKTNELEAQSPRLKEMALGNGPANLRRAAAAAMIMSAQPQAVLTELDNAPIAYEGIARVTDQAKLKQWAGPAMQQAQKGTPPETTIAAIDAIRLLPAESITADNGKMLLGLATKSDDIALRFAAIRAVNALPAGVKPPGTEQLTLTSLEIRAKAGMKYDKETLTVTAGRPVELLFINPDSMEHNLVITLPGRGQGIGFKMSADPAAAAAIGYVPKDNEDVLHHTRMLKQGESQTLRFIAPNKPGKYDYVCTFPGHYGSMNGVLEVVAP
jgi:azurin